MGLPSSSSHALFGGLVGAVIVGAGVEGVNFAAVLTKILIPALVSPVVAGLGRVLRGEADLRRGETHER